MNITQVVGITAAIITASAQLPQLVKIIREKKAADLSIWMLIILMSGLGLWAFYGFLIKDIPILVTNCFSFLINLVITVLRFKYNRK